MSMRDAKLGSLASPYQKLTPTVSTALTVPAGANYALIKTETQAVRWLCSSDNDAPTATDGMLIDIGDELWFTGSLHNLRFIETVSGAVLHVHYFK